MEAVGRQRLCWSTRQTRRSLAMSNSGVELKLPQDRQCFCRSQAARAAAALAIRFRGEARAPSRLPELRRLRLMARSELSRPAEPQVHQAPLSFPLSLPELL